MYSKQEAAVIRTAFWTSFGQYMKPVPSAWKEKVNWLNYKTGIKDIYFRMNADSRRASVSIDIHIPDAVIRAIVFEQFTRMKGILEALSDHEWKWEDEVFNEFGAKYATIKQEIHNVNVFKQQDWPAIISFFKPKMISLDAFWAEAKDGIEMIL